MTKKERISAITAEIQIPFTPINSGRIITAEVLNTKVLKKEMTAEMTPLLKAVKKADPKIFIPVRMKQKA